LFCYSRLRSAVVGTGWLYRLNVREQSRGGSGEPRAGENEEIARRSVTSGCGLREFTLRCASETKLAILSITLIPAADGRVQHIPSIEISQKLRLARERADLIVVSIHWGSEYQRLTGATQRAQARWLIQQGADLIVGHHPHVVQLPECVERHPVFFSLGNHVFDQAYPPTKKGLIADCRLSAGRLSCQAIRTYTKEGTSFPSRTNVDPAVQSALGGCTVQMKKPLGTTDLSRK
jgi:poly-gamma-glutamate synthesis protein (capsule biosynthesis protein)